MTNSTGATAAMLNDSTCTMSVVPTLAPSMIASAGTRATKPSAANEAVISAGRGAALKQRGQPEPGREGRETVAERRRQQMPQLASRTRAGCRCGPCAGPTAAARRRPSVEKNDRAHRDLLATKTPTGNPTGRYNVSKAEPAAEPPMSRIDVERLGLPQAAKPQHAPGSVLHPPIDTFSTWRISGRTARILSKTSCTSSAPTKSGFSLVTRS